jgi:SAM-dependent methyltransferase
MSFPKIERKYVIETYEKIASQFDDTRYSVWPSVKRFLNSLESNSLLFEAGCGNGKNLFYRKDLVPYGCDISQNLVNIAKAKNRENSIQIGDLFLGDITNLPKSYTNFFDNTMSVAVIHHLSTKKRRQKAISELIRVTKPGGRILIQVWSQKDETDEQDSFIPFKNKFSGNVIAERYYHLFKIGELDELLEPFNKITKENIFFEKDNFGVILQKN